MSASRGKTRARVVRKKEKRRQWLSFFIMMIIFISVVMGILIAIITNPG